MRDFLKEIFLPTLGVVYLFIASNYLKSEEIEVKVQDKEIEACLIISHDLYLESYLSCEFQPDFVIEAYLEKNISSCLEEKKVFLNETVNWAYEFKNDRYLALKIRSIK